MSKKKAVQATTDGDTESLVVKVKKGKKGKGELCERGHFIPLGIVAALSGEKDAEKLANVRDQMMAIRPELALSRRDEAREMYLAVTEEPIRQQISMRLFRHYRAAAQKQAEADGRGELTEEVMRDAFDRGVNVRVAGMGKTILAYVDEVSGQTVEGIVEEEEEYDDQEYSDEDDE